ncbi:phosphate/phosphite/phosphonate ABC transporter substrate-binding protein [Salidesulfovibrio onnuriiensis]|uniref:phosphate/phosphite/phosphonate ABC transporter substrate-binding protein n=1 Tax=Salidesulfovibrio onnuriiensis TaxID=2583823 RepID=UPI0011C7C053|nr:phosphate/phosphite/phosphonate ABC transporter substrate-binding protein [Salidesulfovibrio onnuriiensis]
MHSKTAFLSCVLLLLCLVPCGCGGDEEYVRVDFSKREEMSLPVQTKAITYAYLPQYSHAISYGRHKLLIEYLSNATGLPFRQVYPDTFDEHVEMVKRGEIDISFSNPLIYLQLAQLGARAFARIVEPSGQPDFFGEIICRADSPIRTLRDCRGKRWIAVDRSSAGGFLFPLGMLLDNGIPPRDFSDIEFAPGPGGKQEKVVLAVFAGAFDIGSIRQGTLALLKDKIDLKRIRVLARTRPYPSWVYACRKGFPPAQAARIADAMFALDINRADDAVILNNAGIRGIIPAEDGDYDPVRQLVERIREQDGGFIP